MNIVSKLFQARHTEKTIVKSELPLPSLSAKCLEEASQSFKAGDYQTALLHCQHVLDLNPTHTDALRLRGVIRFKLADMAGALEDFEYLLKLT